MKTTRQPEKSWSGKEFQFTYDDWPAEGTKVARIVEWENGEGVDVWLGDDKIQVTYQEANVLEILFGNMRLIK